MLYWCNIERDLINYLLHSNGSCKHLLNYPLVHIVNRYAGKLVATLV